MATYLHGAACPIPSTSSCNLCPLPGTRSFERPHHPIYHFGMLSPHLKLGKRQAASPMLNLSEQKCIQGFGTNDFNTICVFGFCGFANNIVCVDSPTTLYIPTVWPFNPSACTGGNGEGDFSDLCSWSCQYGYCPISSRTCNTQNDLVDHPTQVADVTAICTPVTGVLEYDDLCTFACSHGHCLDVCTSDLAYTSGSGSGNYIGLILPEWRLLTRGNWHWYIACVPFRRRFSSI
ncbi:bb8c686e-2436-4631-949f-215a667f950c [Sclerotinia trifoliorum]|uniref:Bb8c686e-2436-4631-949f-215a667f950c n=1 Tax=Sclerotinia trifoliorum TaxID=28548 RepID=A0A8H2ZJC6_9HELO|nr:bb8c686e-2436-4631-949f-215a667f950c [Sclerotinia trifoliorum]